MSERRDWANIIDRFKAGKRKTKRIALSSSNVASVTRCRLIRDYGFEGITQDGAILVFSK